MRILYGSGWSVYAFAGQNSWLNTLVPDAILDFQVASLVATIVASFRIAKWTEPVTNALTSIGLTIIDLYGQSKLVNLVQLMELPSFLVHTIIHAIF